MSNAYQQTDTILHVENVSVVYGNKTIIEHVNFTEKDTIRPGKQQGQTIAFLGRSGRGKSTLFRVLTGLEAPTTGRILIPDFAKPVGDTGQPAKAVAEGDVGFVNQRYTLFRHKTVLQSLQYAMRKSMVTEAEKQEKIMHYLVEWGLEKVKNQYPNELSGGQRQRTAILEQLLSSGFYMVLDEPFSGLDVGNIQSVKKSFQLITDSHELNTIMFSTHDIELAVELADSIYVMGYSSNPDGSLKQVGTILRQFDLKAMNLSWTGEFDARHLDCAKQIKEVMLAS